MYIIQEDPWAGATNSGLEEKEKTPEKPSPPKIVNQPPVGAVVDEKSDPRVQKNKKRISLSGKIFDFSSPFLIGYLAYRDRKVPETGDKEEEKAEQKDLEEKADEKVDEEKMSVEEKSVEEASADSNMSCPKLEFSTSESESVSYWQKKLLAFLKF